MTYANEILEALEKNNITHDLDVDRINEDIKNILPCYDIEDANGCEYTLILVSKKYYWVALEEAAKRMIDRSLAHTFGLAEYVIISIPESVLQCYELYTDNDILSGGRHFLRIESEHFYLFILDYYTK